MFFVLLGIGDWIGHFCHLLDTGWLDKGSPWYLLVRVSRHHKSFT